MPLRFFFTPRARSSSGGEPTLEELERRAANFRRDRDRDPRTENAEQRRARQDAALVQATAHLQAAHDRGLGTRAAMEMINDEANRAARARELGLRDEPDDAPSASAAGPSAPAAADEPRDLPPGWSKADGQQNYKNEHTGEQIPWVPTAPASEVNGMSADLVPSLAQATATKAKPAAAAAAQSQAGPSGAKKTGRLSHTLRQTA